MAEKDKYADEIISDEELDGVSGGTPFETADDSRFLNVLLRGRPEQPERVGAWRAGYRSKQKEVKMAFASVGIDFEASSDDNIYRIDGLRVSQQAAWAHAEKVVGKHLEKSDWDW